MVRSVILLFCVIKACSGQECATGCELTMVDDGNCQFACSNADCNFDGSDCDCSTGCSPTMKGDETVMTSVIQLTVIMTMEIAVR